MDGLSVPEEGEVERGGPMEERRLVQRTPSKCAGSDCGFVPDERFESMNAIEILRETIRILRHNAGGFLTIAAVLLCPVSAILLSNSLVSPLLVKKLSLRFLLVARSSGLPYGPFLKQSSVRLSEIILSSLFCFPISITVSLIAKAAIVYSVACTYAGRSLSAKKFAGVVSKIWKRLAFTYLWVSLLMLSCVAVFMVFLVTVCNTLVMLGAPSDLISFPAFVLLVAFSVVFAHTTIICNLATVISVLEDATGPPALLRAVYLIKGQTQVGLLIFLGSTIGMAFVEGLFEHRVKTLSYGDGSSRLWEGPLLVIMYSFVVLVDSMMSAVFYFTCRSSTWEVLDSLSGGILPESSPKQPVSPAVRVTVE